MQIFLVMPFSMGRMQECFDLQTSATSISDPSHVSWSDQVWLRDACP